jgi:type I restriction enzyme M protein
VRDTDRTAKAFFVPVEEIRANQYDLSINRYKEVAYEVVEHEAPEAILGKLRQIEVEIGKDLEALGALLK